MGAWKRGAWKRGAWKGTSWAGMSQGGQSEEPDIPRRRVRKIEDEGVMSAFIAQMLDDDHLYGTGDAWRH